MTVRISLAALALVLSACSIDPPTTSEYMIISPKSITFAKGDSATAVSITHSCTCAFSWHASLTPASAVSWLVFPTDTTGDHKSLPMITRPSLYPNDTNEAWISINSNHYGADTIHVIAIR